MGGDALVVGGLVEQHRVVHLLLIAFLSHFCRHNGLPLESSNESQIKLSDNGFVKSSWMLIGIKGLELVKSCKVQIVLPTYQSQAFVYIDTNQFVKCISLII